MSYLVKDKRSGASIAQTETLHRANELAYSYERQHWESDTAVFDEWGDEIPAAEDIEDYIADAMIRTDRDRLQPISMDEALELMRKWRQRPTDADENWEPDLPYGISAYLVRQVWNELLKEGII